MGLVVRIENWWFERMRVRWELELFGAFSAKFWRDK